MYFICHAVILITPVNLNHILLGANAQSRPGRPCDRVYNCSLESVAITCKVHTWNRKTTHVYIRGVPVIRGLPFPPGYTNAVSFFFLSSFISFLLSFLSIIISFSLYLCLFTSFSNCFISFVLFLISLFLSFYFSIPHFLFRHILATRLLLFSRF
jgi:hypothetical protein